jgi:hypothetical protein
MKLYVYIYYLIVYIYIVLTIILTYKLYMYICIFDYNTIECFDLLDAISCSGSLLINNTTLHIIMGFTHCFHNTLINTVIQDNINPIENIQLLQLIITQNILNKSWKQLINEEYIQQLIKDNNELYQLLLQADIQ